MDTPPAEASRPADPAGRSLRWAAAAGAVAVAAIIALSAARADAQTEAGLQSKIDAARSQAQSIAAEIDATSGRLAAARESAAAAAARESELTGLLAAGEQREAELVEQVAIARERLAQVRARLDRALDALAQRLVAIYKSDAADATALLLTSDGYDDLTTRVEMIQRIQRADTALAERVRELRAEVSRRLEAVDRARARQAAHNDAVAAARDQIAAVRASAEARAAALDQARADQAAALAGLRSNVSSWTAQVQRLQQATPAAAQQEVASWVGDWAIPSAIVMCESGGNYNAVNPSSGAGGAYQIMPSTWDLYGGSGSPHQASQAEQDRIAAQIWADSGASAWECAR